MPPGPLTTLDGSCALAPAIVEHCWGSEVSCWKRPGANDYGVGVLAAVLTGVPLRGMTWSSD